MNIVILQYTQLQHKATGVIQNQQLNDSKSPIRTSTISKSCQFIL